MKNKRRSLPGFRPGMFILLAFTLLFTACQPAPIQAGISPLVPPAALPTSLPAPTPFPSSTPTEVVIPTATLTETPASAPSSIPLQPTPDCRSRTSQIEPLQIDGGALGLLQAQIYLPPCFQTAPSVRYPVLYLLHGMNSDDQQWLRLGAQTAADSLIASGQAPPFLIVMPTEQNDLDDPNESNFPDILTSVLIPWIDQNYPTCADRACRAIGGLSRGSGWALRLGFMDWQTFGEIGAHSFSPFAGDIDRLPIWLQRFSASQRPLLYLDIGTYDEGVAAAKAFEAEFTQYRVPHEWHLFEGAHNEDYWSSHITDYLRWYAQGWQTR